MQPVRWYAHRLRAMSPGEVCWRGGNKLRTFVDFCCLPGWATPPALQHIMNGKAQPAGECSAVLGKLPPVGFEPTHAFQLPKWREELLSRAEQICENRLTLFNLENHHLGPEIWWNYEYAAAKPTPIGFAPHIDYRDYRVTGDAKLVWELNRHQHLVILGRAYRLTGETRFAQKVVQDLESWIDQCPFGRGMNWRSPLELAIRLINWVWAWELIRPSGVLTSEHRSRFLPVVYRHLWDIARKYSRYSSANNHLIGEAAGVFIGSSYFSILRGADSWAERSRQILLQEIMRQTHDDGGHVELAMGYHLFVLEFFLLAGLVARNTGRDFPPEYWQRLEKMFEFVAALTDGVQTPPMFGDCDDGYVLDLGHVEHRSRGLVATGAVLFNRSDFKRVSGGFAESSSWLLGEEGYNAFEEIEGTQERPAFKSQAFKESGYYVLRSGDRDGHKAITVTFDCGPLGFETIAAHGHADALSFTLNAFGMDVLIDPGTYDYFSYPQWRDYFRSTRAHNTIVVDDEDQSEMLGPFMWGSRAKARCVQWQPSQDGGTVIGQHDGYMRLSRPVSHRRTVTLDGAAWAVTIEDELTGNGRHAASMFLHFAEDCRVDKIDGNQYEVDREPGRVLIDLDAQLSVNAFRGSLDPILGWVSRGYHRRQPCTTLVGRRWWCDHIKLITRIIVAPPRTKPQSSGAKYRAAVSQEEERLCTPTSNNN